MFFAHSCPGEQANWDVLEEHLQRTAHRAAEFLPHAPALAYMAGMWHDVGKYQLEFQRYLLLHGEPIYGVYPELNEANRKRFEEFKKQKK